MSDTPTFTRRLRFTPLLDLLRFRVSGRLDWRGRISVGGLPAALRDHVECVVRHTRLWRSEQADVADELLAHFTDGLDAGVSPEELAQDFGDEQLAARLIRRAKRRNRPLLWRIGRVIGWVLASVVAVYAVSLGQFLLGRPSPRIDYAAQLNAPEAAVSLDQRAYPLYAQAAEQLRASIPGWDTSNRVLAIRCAHPGDAAWPQTVDWLHSRAGTLALIRQAADRPVLGLFFKQNTPEAGSETPIAQMSPTELLVLSQAAALLRQDAQAAVLESDAGRLSADVAALLGVARHFRGPYSFWRWHIEQTTSAAIEVVEDAVRNNPAVFTEQQWATLAHRLANLGENPALDTRFAEASFADMLQHVYTDDGHGDGYPTLVGLRLLKRAQPRASDPNFAGSWIAKSLYLGAPIITSGATTWFDSRATVRASYQQLLDAGQAQLQRPLSEADWTEVERLYESGRTRNWPVRSMFSGLIITSGMQRNWVALTTYRDGVTVGIALEIFHRRHGQYPASLDLLVPNLLPAVPLDPADGKPLRYRLIDDRPVVYSVGMDKIDNGGHSPPLTMHSPTFDTAMAWPKGVPAASCSGDFVLMPRPADLQLPSDQ